MIVDNTHDMEYPKSISPEVKAAMQAYFVSKEASFKSFASLRVIGAGAAIAVVNVECSQTHVFGTDEEDKKGLVEYLFPFCSILGILFGGR